MVRSHNSMSREGGRIAQRSSDIGIDNETVLDRGVDYNPHISYLPPPSMLSLNSLSPKHKQHHALKKISRKKDQFQVNEYGKKLEAREFF